VAVEKKKRETKREREREALKKYGVAEVEVEKYE